MLLNPPGVLEPTAESPAGLDLVVLQLTQQLDGSAIPSPSPTELELVALPLGFADEAELAGKELVLLGFGTPRGHIRGNARPKHPKFSTIAVDRTGGTGRWIETDVPMMHEGHSGGPALGPRGDVVGWSVRTLGVDQLRPVDERFEEALAAALDGLGEEALGASASSGPSLRERLADPIHGGGHVLPTYRVAPPPYRLDGVPNLPEQYQRRPDLEEKHRNTLLRTGTMTITAATTGVSGPAGAGKSTMAICLARDLDVQAHFSDGITWLPFGRERTGADVLYTLAPRLGVGTVP